MDTNIENWMQYITSEYNRIVAILDIMKKYKEIRKANRDCLPDYRGFDFLSPICYSLIASFHKSNGYTSPFLEKCFSDHVCSYMERVGLFERLWIVNQSWSYRNILQLIPLKTINNLWQTDEIGLEVAKIVNTFQVYSGVAIDNLKYMISELFDNVIQHGNDYTSNFLAAHYYRDKWYLQIAIVDSGSGIRKSLWEKYQPKTHEEAIQKAIEKNVTGYVPSSPYGGTENQGMGLTTALNIVKMNGGDMIIWSGDSMYILDSSNPKEYIHQESIPMWDGTFICFNLYANKPNTIDWSTVLWKLEEDSELATEHDLDTQFTIDF